MAYLVLSVHREVDFFSLFVNTEEILKGPGRKKISSVFMNFPEMWSFLSWR